MAAVIKLKSMPTTDMDRFLAHPDASPETLAIRGENTAENKEVRRHTAERDAMEEKIRSLLDEEFATLKPTERGDLIVLWTDWWGYSHAEIAERLPLTENASRRAKWRARWMHPFCETGHTCQGVAGCPHHRGEELWKSIFRNIVSKVGCQGGGEA